MSTEPDAQQPPEHSPGITVEQLAEARRDLAIAMRSLALLNRKRDAQAAEIRELRTQYAKFHGVIDGMRAKLDRAKDILVELANGADDDTPTGAVTADRRAGHDA